MLGGRDARTPITYREGELLPVNLLQQPQEIYGRGNIARLVELSYEQKLFDDHLTVKFGRLPEGEFNDFSLRFRQSHLLRPAGYAQASRIVILGLRTDLENLTTPLSAGRSDALRGRPFPKSAWQHLSVGKWPWLCENTLARDCDSKNVS